MAEGTTRQDGGIVLIKIYVNEVGGGWSPWDQFLRGTEDFAREFAVSCQKMGHTVFVYHNGKHGTYRGVYFLPREAFEAACDYLLVIKEATLLDRNLEAAKRIVYYTNDIDDRERLTPERMAKVEQVAALSQWHKDNLLQGIPRVEVYGHAVHPLRSTFKKKKQRGLCVYASSHDRGLEELQAIWPKVKAAVKDQVPGVELEIAYNGRSEQQMDELYQRAEFWAYPCKGVELFCITGARAQQSLCIPVVIPHMAVGEIVKCGYMTKPGDTIEDYKTLLIAALTDQIHQNDNVRSQLATIHWKTHDELAAELLAVYPR